MLNYREEIELHAARENHIACLMGAFVGVFATIGFLLYGLCAGRNWAVVVGLVELVVTLLFFARGRRPLRRIRELEEFL